ncbi:hypothetical protein DDE18_21245 [Nocardioides gansuensis]|uniref:Thiamine pyrophosphate-requiring protein n=1 Tax=Nocardioides gansuensis TaxID=2138300 RepID=A0A2T8F525_9ACTN|nr:thiamine pyrophosphate-dependent enzyme [Nocardioides gansuensis]PVG80780.1 hypothetical protein DDE18_21245 [Nocardioides gansuensis]
MEFSVTSLGPRGTAAAEVLLTTLAAAGIERLWFCSGSELVPLQEAAARMRAREERCPALAPAIHEHVAICAAMGESMVTGRPVAVAAHADLGPLNFGAELHTAFRGGYPLLILSGYPATHPERRTSQAFWNQQRWDHGEALRQYTKWDYRVAAHEPLGTVVARALQVARTEPTGPVQLTVPAEVLAAATVVGGPDSADRLAVAGHGGGHEPGIREIARRLLGADRPLLLTERAGKDPRAVHLLAELCERYALGCRSTRFRMSLPSQHPAQLAAPRVPDADVVLVLEHHVPWIPAVDPPGSDTWVAVVGQDPIAAEIPLHELGADLRMYAAPAEFLTALLAELDRQAPKHHERTRRRAERLAGDAQAAGAELERARRDALAEPHLTHAALGAALDQVLHPDDILVDELGDTLGLSRRSEPGTLFQNGGSSLGWATSACVGAGLAAPDRVVVCSTGDGAYLFGGPAAALWAQRRYDVPVLTVIANNGGYRTGTSHVDDYYPDGEVARTQDYTGGVFDPVPDHAAEARAAGAVAFTVSTPAELLAALAEGREIVRRHRTPVVVDALLPTHTGDRHAGPAHGTSHGKARR